MAAPALLDALREQTAADVAAVWQRARADADDRSQAQARATDAAIEAIVRRNAADIAEDSRAARAQAEDAARAIRTDARSALSDRARRLAIASLPALRDAGYADLFRDLIAELPRRAWTRIIVHPADAALAGQCLANVAVTTDAAIVAGLIVEGGGLRVTNTLETRLDSAWPDLLAAVMNDAAAQCPRT